MVHYVALLRGINVGGKNLMKMSDLKKCFETEGFRDVCTYIQSGNVLFLSGDKDQTKLAESIEILLSRTFRYNARVVVRSYKQMKNIVQHAPLAFGCDPATYRYDILFLMEPLTAREAMKSVTTKEGVDQAMAGSGVLYFSRLIEKAAQSHMARLVSLPVYQHITIRNWNTTTRLLKIMEPAENQ